MPGVHRLYAPHTGGRRSNCPASSPAQTALADSVSDRDIALWPASRLAGSLQKGDLSPVQVAEACLRRVEQHNQGVNAIVTVNPHLLEEAARLERRTTAKGLLYGLPAGIKDTTPVAGVRTTFGSPLFKDFVPGRDGLVVQRLKAAGALILGKTNTPEFATGGTTDNAVFGPTRNPWNLDLTPGGSTGGGAAALAAGMVALADGSDLGGSLRLPASFCGVVGLRPSPGLVPTAPSAFLWDMLSVAGGMGRTAEDIALFLQATHGPSPDSPVSQPHSARSFVEAVRQGPPPGLRLAYCHDLAGMGVEAAIADACQRASRELSQAGATVENIAMDLSWARPAFDALRALQLCVTHKERLNKRESLGRNLASNLESALNTSIHALALAERARTRLWQRFKGFFRRHDYLLTPCAAVAPFPVDQDYPTHVAGRPVKTYYDWFASTYILSLTGLPVASVPCTLDAHGLPVGLQVVGPPQGEEGVLAIAQAIQLLCPIGLP